MTGSESRSGQLNVLRQYKEFAQRLRDGDMFKEPLSWPNVSDQIHMAADTIDALLALIPSEIQRRECASCHEVTEAKLASCERVDCKIEPAAPNDKNDALEALQDARDAASRVAEDGHAESGATILGAIALADKQIVRLERELAETRAKYERLQQSAVEWQERIAELTPSAEPSSEAAVLRRELQRLQQWFVDREERPGHKAQYIHIGMALDEAARYTPSHVGDSAALAALRELVRLKDVKELIESDIDIESAAALQADYDESKPKAWAAARAALSVTPSAIGESEGYPGIAHDLETLRTALITIRDECFNGHAHDIAERALNSTSTRNRGTT